MAHESYVLEWVRCGKAGCKACPHGPYWYAYRSEGNKTRKRYVGKKDPRPAPEPSPADAPKTPPRPPDWRDAINDRARASGALARRILGVGPDAGRDECASAFRRGMFRHHPDRGGDPVEAGYLSAAWSYLRWAMSW